MAKVLIVGAGAAGLMAAGAAVRQGHQVTVLEHMDKPAQKILVTGKGRCNVTNDCTAEEFLHHVRTNPRFLFSSLGAFPSAKTMELFESLGVELKVERGRRVFPVSDKAEEIRQALLRYAQDAELVHDGARKLLLEELPPEAEEAPAVPENPRHPKKKKAGPALRCIGVRGTSGREYRADAVLVATGGVSYPTTGSTGDGYKLARQAGHTLVEPVPSLVSLVSHDPDCKKMMGLALKNVTLTLFEDGKAIFDEQGEMLFTHFGISGPLTLSASSHLGDMKKHKYHAEIDLKPALSEEQLYDRITRDFALLANHAAQGALVKLLPSSMQPVMVARWGIDPATKANQITREQKRELVQLIKHWRVSIDARGDLAHAEQKGPGAVLCRRGAGRGRLHRRLQPADRFLHGSELCQSPVTVRCNHTIGNSLRSRSGYFQRKIYFDLAFAAPCGELQTHFHRLEPKPTNAATGKPPSPGHGPSGHGPFCEKTNRKSPQTFLGYT